MKVSQNWLKELVDINSTPEVLAEKLSIGGFEVESLKDTSLQVKGVLLGNVLSVEKHPNSTKLSVCQVDIGNKNILQIVCGAKNIKSDIHVYVATVGSYLSSIDLSIKKSEIRGVSSEGMICSLEELGLDSNTDGIEIIDPLTIKDHKLGTEASKILGLNDHIFDLAITANRPDGMSVIGIAREISALLQTKLTLPPEHEIINLNAFKENKLCQETINKECIYTISFIDNVNGKQTSPKWIKERLEKSDIKSKNLIVDITNYILLEQGQPLHAFDLDKLSQLIGREVLPEDFGVRKAKNGEFLMALDGIKYELNENISIVVCSDKPVAIAGVIGGLETAVTEQTSSIILEGAVFNPSIIRKSSREVGIRTESSSRFEKGISYRNTLNSLSRAFYLLNKYFKESKPTIYTSKIINQEKKSIKLRRERIFKILGPIVYNSKDELGKMQVIKRNLNDKEIIDKLKLIGCELHKQSYGWDVEVISNRSSDLIREIDLIEEIARLIGYDQFDQNLPAPINPGKLNSYQLAKRKLKNGFVISGFNEVLTYSLVSDEDKTRIKISNPLLQETSCLRNNIWQEHIRICNQNIKAGRESCWIFETGNIFVNSSTNNQIEILSGAISGNNYDEKWESSGKSSELNYYQARGKLRQVFSHLNVSVFDKPTDKYKYLHPGRTSLLIIEGKEAGYFGQINPKYIAEKKSLKNLFLFSIDIDKLLMAAIRTNKWTPIFKDYPIVPKIERDINFIFSNEYLVSDIIRSIKKSGKTILEEVKLIDIYNDDNLDDKFVSYTFRLSYRDKEKTLVENDVVEINELIIKNIEKKFSAKQKI